VAEIAAASVAVAAADSAEMEWLPADAAGSKAREDVVTAAMLHRKHAT